MRVRREPPEAEPDLFSMPIVDQAKNDSECHPASEGVHASADGALLFSGECHYASASGTTTTTGSDPVPAAVLQDLHRRNTAQTVHFLNPQTAYTAFPPVMAVGPPLWLQSNGQTVYGSVSLTSPTGHNSLGGANGQFSQPHGPGDLLPQQIPVYHPGTILPPYTYTTVPVAFPGVPLFYGQGAPYVESLKMPFHRLNTTLHNASLPDYTALAAPGAQSAIHDEKNLEHGEPTVRKLHSPEEGDEISSKETES
jgi:hypothetical protein